MKTTDYLLLAANQQYLQQIYMEAERKLNVGKKFRVIIDFDGKSVRDSWPTEKGLDE